MNYRYSLIFRRASIVICTNFAHACHMANFFSGYTNRQNGENLPLGWYSLVSIVFVILAILVIREAVHARLEISAGTLFILAAGVHKLSRIITKATVTSPFRAALTRYQYSLGYGEFQEISRRDGFFGTIGDLISCNYCADAWVALAGIFGLVHAYSTTVLTAQALTVIALADFFHVIYETIRTEENVLTAEEEIKKDSAKNDANNFSKTHNN